MTTWKQLTAILLAAFGMMLAVPAAAQTDLPQPDGPWLHPAAGVPFPEMLGGLERIRIVSYDDDSTNASVGYNGGDANGRLILTIYVYPSRDENCAQEFANSVAPIANYQGSALVFERMAAAPDGKRQASARHSRYIIPAGAIRDDLPRMVSDAYLFCSPDQQWFVKYRASWTGSAETFPDVMQLISGIAWPGTLLGME